MEVNLAPTGQGKLEILFIPFRDLAIRDLVQVDKEGEWLRYLGGPSNDAGRRGELQRLGFHIKRRLD